MEEKTISMYAPESQKIKMIFSSDDSRLKMLYLDLMDITKKMDRPQIGLGIDLFLAKIFFEESLAGL